jgi:putative hydrolase of the HAD superfamily
MKPTLIFDYDDTLGGVLLDGKVVPGYMAYNDTIRRFGDVMHSMGFDRQEALDTQSTIDRTMATQCGFADKSRFAESFRHTYSHLSLTQTGTLHRSTADSLFSLGMTVFTGYPYVPLEHALDVLEHFKGHYRISVLTKGEPEEQYRKLRDSGVANFTDHVKVVGRKNATDWQATLRELDLWGNTHRCWSIGNSVKADVNPALLLGLNALHLNDPDGWTFENAEYETPLPGRELGVITGLSECLLHIPV